MKAVIHPSYLWSIYSTVPFFFSTYYGDLDVFHLSFMSLILSLDFLSHFPEASSPKSKRFLQTLLANDSSLHPLCAEVLCLPVWALWALLGPSSNTAARFPISFILLSSAASCSLCSPLRKLAGQEKWEMTGAWLDSFLQIVMWAVMVCNHRVSPSVF